MSDEQILGDILLQKEGDTIRLSVSWEAEIATLTPKDARILALKLLEWSAQLTPTPFCLGINPSADCRVCWETGLTIVRSQTVSYQTALDIEQLLRECIEHDARIWIEEVPRC